MSKDLLAETRIERLGKSFWFRALLVTFPIWFALLAEGGLRTFYYFRYGVPGKSYGIWRYDKDLSAAHKESSYNSNAYLNDFGFRNRENVWEPKPAGSLRIIAYGGSTTFCYNLLNDEAWPLQLQKLIRGKRPGGANDQVLNGGVILWSLGQIAVKIRRDIPKLKPDYVLIYSGVNEFTNSSLMEAEGRSLKKLVAEKRYGEFAHNLDQDNWFVRNSILYKALRNYVMNPLRDLRQSLWMQNSHWKWPKDPDPDVLTNYLETLHGIVDFLKSSGVKAVFIEELYAGDERKNHLLTSYSREGARHAAEWGAIVVSTSEMFQNYAGDRRKFFTGSGVHLTEDGARLFANYLYGKLF